MTGVEILAIKEVATAFGFGWFAFWFVLILSIAFFTFIGYAADSSNKVHGWLIGLLIGVPLSLALALIAGCAAGDPTECETQYKVTISDEVSMNDFLARYEIIDQEGKIYTVREKNNGK